jgi:N-acetylneuraminic acid mutarotase
VDAFDPAANRWDALPSLPRPHGDAACLVIGGDMVIFGGGSNDSTETTAWSFRRGAWEPEPAMALPAPRKSLAAAIVGQTAFAIGGFASANDKTSATRTVWAREARARRWEERAPVPGPARFNPAAAAVGGRLILAGGATMDRGRLENLDDVIAYDPAADRWSALGRLLFANRAGSGLEARGKFLLIGGFTDRFEPRIFSFDPSSGQTVPAGLLPAGLADSRFLTLGGRIFGVGGECGVKLRSPLTIEAGPI